MAPTTIKPTFIPGNINQESSRLAAIIKQLSLQPHPEGGYFIETDRDELLIPSPFTVTGRNPNTARNASTTIFYLLTPTSPQGHFHRNAGRTVHTLHWGRGRYVLVHADDTTNKKRVESFIVGKDVMNGEKLQWIVDGGKYKASYLLADDDRSSESSQGCLISETVVPGFEYSEHDFLEADVLPQLVSRSQTDELSWLLRSS